MATKTSALKDSLGSIPIPPPVIIVSLSQLGITASQFLAHRGHGTSVHRFKASTGKLLALCGALISLWAAITMIKDGQSPNPGNEKTKIVTSGPFRFTRNPIYLGATATALGRSISKNSFLGVVLSMLGWFYVDQIVVPKEEQYLLSKLEDQYATYLTATPRWIQPKK